MINERTRHLVHTKNHPRMVLSRALKGSAKDAPASTDGNGRYTSVTITERASNKTADQSAEVVDGDLFV